MRERCLTLTVTLMLLATVGCADRAWRHGYVASQLPDGFILQERFYPHTEVHVSSSTRFRCGKQILGLADLRPNELVTVEGGYRKDGSVEATKVTIRRERSDCKSAVVIPKPNMSGSKIEPKFLLGLLIDTSKHQKNVIEFERGAVRSIAEKFGWGESFVCSYGSKVQVLEDWSASDNQLKTAAAQISLDAGDGHGTRLYDAMHEALLKLSARTGPNLRVLIVIGEGNDSGSSARYSEVKALAESSHVHCFALLVADHNLRGGRVRHFGWYLNDLASATNGAGYDIEDSQKNLDKALRDALKRIDQQSSQASF
jgi:hypothetical protein